MKLHFKKLFTTILFFIVFVFISFGQYAKLFDFSGTLNGATPYADLVSDGTFLYGTVESGGTNNLGLVFKIKPDGTGYDTLLNFRGSNGSYCKGSLIYDGSYLYGMTETGGVYDGGVIFKIKPNGTGYSKLHDFDGTNGGAPFGSLFFDGVFLYGMTNGGVYYGTLFKIKTDGTAFIKLLDFIGLNGSFPFGNLISDGTFLYGMTPSGGINDTSFGGGDGLIFKIKPDGTGYSTLFNFNVGNGYAPYGSLISDGIFLYGMAGQGGAYGDGVIFKIKPDGTGYSKLMDFSSIINGQRPNGSLIFDGTFLYGMTGVGGVFGDGVIFKIKPDGTGFYKLFDFDGVNGATPNGSLISDGAFLYGMAYGGGSNGDGVVFKIGLATGIVENQLESTIEVYPNPATNVSIR